MTQRARRSAGNEVLRLVEQFSTALLAAETACFAQQEQVFGAALPGAIRVVTSRAAALNDDVGRIAADQQLTGGLRSRMTRVLDAARTPVVTLTERSMKLALSSIEAELRVCESTLGAKYRGITDVAVAQAAQASADLADAGIRSYMGNDQARLVGFASDLNSRLMTWRVHGEDRDKLIRRLLSEAPVRLPGQSGVGVWWTPLSAAQASARELAIGLSNRVREAAMQAFNDEGDRR